MTQRILLVDAGGTFTRFALSGSEGTIEDVSVLESGTYRSFEDAAATYLTDVNATVSGIAVAAAGPVMHGVVTLTNGPQWRIDPAAVKHALGATKMALVNDFAAVAASAAVLGGAAMQVIAQGEADPSGAIAVVGPGTGLGVALVARDSAGFRVMPGEGGHAALAPTNEREIAVLFQLIRRFGHVKAEYVLSGTGLEILWQTLCELDGMNDAGKPTAGEIAERARRKSDPVAVETIAMMTGWLGSFAGDVALIAGATGGVVLAGGVLPRWGAMFDTALFCRRFCAKSAHRTLMERIPVKLIVDKEAAFKGLIALLKAAA